MLNFRFINLHIMIKSLDFLVFFHETFIQYVIKYKLRKIFLYRQQFKLNKVH